MLLRSGTKRGLNAASRAVRTATSSSTRQRGRKKRKTTASATTSPRNRRSVATAALATPVKMEIAEATQPRAPPPAAAGDWLATLELVEELRADRTAPVDEFGSEAVPQRPPVVDLSTFRYQCLIALMLSSQTKDAMVSKAMRAMQSSSELAGGLCVAGVHAADQDTIHTLIQGVGFWNRKADYIKRTTAIIVTEHAGEVPSTMKGLLALPGVGPKMSLIVLSAAFNKCVGVSIDTHLHRILPRLGWTKVAKSPEQTRRQLEAWLPREHWPTFNLIWVGFGQELQQQKPKLLKKALACSDPPRAVKLLRTLGVGVKREARKAGVELPYYT